MVSVITHCSGMFGILGKCNLSLETVGLVRSKQNVNRTCFSKLSMSANTASFLLELEKASKWKRIRLIVNDINRLFAVLQT